MGDGKFLLFAALLAVFISSSVAQSGDGDVCGNSANVLTTDCSDKCDSDELCVRQVEDDECDFDCSGINYSASFTHARVSTIILLPYGDYQSSYEKKHGGENWKDELDSLTDDRSNWPHYSDDVVNTIGPLKLPSKIDKVYIQGGSSEQEFNVRGKVAQANFEKGFLNESPGIKAVQIGNIDFSDSYPDFSKMTDTKLEFLSVQNCLLSDVPESIVKMDSLDMLFMKDNFFSTFDVELRSKNLTMLKLSGNGLKSFTAVIPDTLVDLGLAHNDLTSLDTTLPEKLGSLDLAENNFTSFPTALENAKSLSIFKFYNNPLSNVNVTSTIYSVLDNVETLKMSHEVDTSACSNRKLVKHSFYVCIVESLDDMSPLGPGVAHDSKDSSADNHGISSTFGDVSSSSSGGMGITESESEGFNSIYIVYIAILVVAVLLIVIGVLYLKLRKHRQGGKNISTGAATSEKSVFTVGSKYSLWADETMLALQMNNEDVEDVQRIGGGAYGEVWLVLYRRTTYFASKRLVTGNKGPGLATRLVDEIKLASSLDHPNIVELVGAVWTNETDLQALFEYMPNGDLRSYLINPRTPKKWTKEKLRIAVGVAEALVYVHSFLPPLLHRDLKSPNILLSEMNEAKVTDFGVSRYSSEVGTNTTGVGTAKWLAPEVLTGDGTYDDSSDCYSFGVVLSELDTHELPYFDAQSSSGGEMADVALLNRVAEGTIQPSFSDTCPPAIRDLGMRCLSFNPIERPRATEIAYKLRSILKDRSW